jgi:hypothetical protein
MKKYALRLAVALLAFGIGHWKVKSSEAIG